eukprot:g8094.t1
MMRLPIIGRTPRRRVWAFAVAAAATASITVALRDQASPEGGKDTNDTKVYLKPDLDATAFSAQNGYFFANMSKLAYQDEHNIKKTLEEMEDCKGLHEHFQFHESGPGQGEGFFEGIRDMIQDTQGFIAANDDVILVVFRGTQEIIDWVTNLRGAPRGVDWCSPRDGCSIHRGFDDAMNSMWEPMHKQIKELYGDGKGRKLYIAGHSLGGALATVAAARLAFEDDINVAGVYTIAGAHENALPWFLLPLRSCGKFRRVFDVDLARNFDAKVNHGIPMKDKTFRGRNNNDAVPRVPPPVPYAHIGTEVYFDRFGIISTTSLTDRLLGRLRSFVRLSPIDGIADHDAGAYVTLFEEAVIASRLSLLAKTKGVMKDAAKKVMPTPGSDKSGDEL